MNLGQRVKQAYYCNIGLIVFASRTKRNEMTFGTQRKKYGYKSC